MLDILVQSIREVVIVQNFRIVGALSFTCWYASLFCFQVVCFTWAIIIC